jgi:hypothetical protein
MFQASLAHHQEVNSHIKQSLTSAESHKTIVNQCSHIKQSTIAQSDKTIVNQCTVT